MVKRKEWNYGKKGLASRMFDLFNILFMVFFMLATLYPFLYVLFASLSDPIRFMAREGVLLHPLGFQLDGYRMVLQNSSLRNGYMVTLFVVVVGTSCNVAFSLLFAYFLSRRNLMFHNVFTFLAVFTMYFSGGMIPTYLVVRGVGLIDSLWALIIPGLISTYNVIILRTAFNSIPQEMEESAKIDGAGNMRILTQILIPLIVPTIAAITLFYMVGHWNSWTSALIYIKTPQKFPLQLVLRSILIQNDANSTIANTMDYNFESAHNYALKQMLKYVTIMVSIIPIICIYPFLQKYFTKGVMIGALKG